MPEPARKTGVPPETKDQLTEVLRVWGEEVSGAQSKLEQQIREATSELHELGGLLESQFRHQGNPELSNGQPQPAATHDSAESHAPQRLVERIETLESELSYWKGRAEALAERRDSPLLEQAVERLNTVSTTLELRLGGLESVTDAASEQRDRHDALSEMLSEFSERTEGLVSEFRTSVPDVDATESLRNALTEQISDIKDAVTALTESVEKSSEAARAADRDAQLNSVESDLKTLLGDTRRLLERADETAGRAEEHGTTLARLSETSNRLEALVNSMLAQDTKNVAVPDRDVLGHAKRAVPDETIPLDASREQLLEYRTDLLRFMHQLEELEKSLDAGAVSPESREAQLQERIAELEDILAIRDELILQQSEQLTEFRNRLD